MPTTEVMEEELLRSIEEVEARISKFRTRVRGVLAEIQADGQVDQTENSSRLGG